MDAIATASQRRNLTVLFADLCGSTRISGTLEPEQFAALLEQLRALVDVIIERHGGLVVRIDGDGATCVFGYPVAAEDSARRATEAALDLHAAVIALDHSFAFPDVPIRLHSGIHSGLVLVREGDLVRGRIEMLGDATNVAARLCDHAGPDEIVVSETCLGADRHFFEAARSEAVVLSGRTNPIPALVITGRAEVSNRFAARTKRGIAPFSGRETVLAQLRALLDAAGQGAVQRLTIIGEPGIGKTRLMSEFLDEAAANGVAVHRGYCEAYLGAKPLQAFEQIADSIAASQPDAETSSEPDIIGRMQRWASSGADRRTIVAIDDWQWADDATHNLLDTVARLRGGNLLILLASRPDTGQADEADEGTKIVLTPLSASASEQAIRGLMVGNDPFRIQRICDMAGGSPLFIEELCHADDALLADSAASASPSAWLDGLIQTRFLDLPDDQARLLRIASVIGHILPSRLFSTVASVGADDPRIAALQVADFLYAGEVEGTLRFKHVLTRDAIYRVVGLDERRRLHALVAKELAAFATQDGEDDYLDALAYHHAACGDVRQACAYSIKAGDRAMALAALDRAQGHYRYALTHIVKTEPTAADLVNLIVKYGRAAVIDPSLEQLPVLDYARRLAEETGNREAAMFAGYWAGAIQYGLGNARESLANIELACALVVPGQRPGFDGQLLSNLGQSHAIASNFSEARDYLGQAIDRRLAELKRGRGNPGHAYSFGSRGYVLAVQGHFADAYRDFDAAFATLDGVDHPVRGSVTSLRALACLVEGRLDQCLALIREAIAISLSARARYLVVSCRAVEDYAQWLQTGDDRHVEALASRVEWLLGSGSRQRLSNNHGWLAEMFARRGEAAEAEHHYRAACARADAGDRLGETIACRAMARLAAEGRVTADPFEYLERGYASARLRQSPREQHETDLCAADVHGLLGNPDQAHALRQRAIAGFTALGMQHRLEQIRQADP